MTQYHSPDRNPVEEMEDIGRMESEYDLFLLPMGLTSTVTP